MSLHFLILHITISYRKKKHFLLVKASFLTPTGKWIVIVKKVMIFRIYFYRVRLDISLLSGSVTLLLFVFKCLRFYGNDVVVNKAASKKYHLNWDLLFFPAEILKFSIWAFSFFISYDLMKNYAWDLMSAEKPFLSSLIWVFQSKVLHNYVSRQFIFSEFSCCRIFLFDHVVSAFNHNI